MSKWAGNIGYCITEETAPSVWTPTIVERHYTGDTLEFTFKNENGQGVNDNVNVTVNLSIIADPFALKNCSSIKYATYLGLKWKVLSVKPMYPRMVLYLGGVYNE